ncbi:MAG TPA: hypothetical protein VJR89_39475, partial [Polyangiales bacterium]|nr:hypothetical protein [Polyangiales bacterium]
LCPVAYGGYARDVKRAASWNVNNLLQLLVLALVVGFVIRVAGDFEGLRPTGGTAPILVSTGLFAILWLSMLRLVSVWPHRLASAVGVLAVVAVAAGAVWTVYAVLPGAVGAALLLSVIAAIRT